MHPGLQCCAVLAAVVLILVAITGPVYAFFFMSCVSTRPCVIGRRLQSLDMTCAEGAARTELLLHGERCTLQCPLGYAANLPSIQCVDGVVEGLEEAGCRQLPVMGDGPQVGGLVSGAVTGGELKTACRRAQGLRCSAQRGGSAVLVQLTGLSKATCLDLLEECRAMSNQFHWSQFSEGTCSLGCFVNLLPDEETQEALDAAAIAAAQVRAMEGVFGTSPEDSVLRPTCSEGPICITLKGSCNEGDDGDYYRHPLCASLFTQWVQQDTSHRLRYDGNVHFSQSGKWIIESGADALLDGYGVELARHPDFTASPNLGVSLWSAQCRTRINSFTYHVDPRKVSMTLSACTCTADQDCSGNGQVVGSKEFGPNCRCWCKEGFDGDNCEVKLCRAEDVLHAASPPCFEGRYVQPGQACTPRCNPGFMPNSESFLCEDGHLLPLLFKCTPIPGLDQGSAGEETATKPPEVIIPCTELDCLFRGTPLGERGPDGTCTCVCEAGYGGPDCRTIVGSCVSPLQKSMAHSAARPCEEGSVVETTCTAQCEDGYYPIPSELTCTGTDLSPSTFTCFGGPTARQTWCLSMRYIAISASCVSVVALLGGCLFLTRRTNTKTKAFITAKQLVEVHQDDHGSFKVVRPGGKEQKSCIPEHIINAVQPELFTQPVGEDSVSSLHALADAPSLRRLADATPATHELALVEASSLEEEYGEVSSFQGRPKPPPVPRLRVGYEVLVHGFEEEEAVLNGSRGRLLSQEEPGLWLVALEGRNGVQRLHEEHLVDTAEFVEPDSGPTEHKQWLVQLYQLDCQAQEAKRAHEAQFMTKQQRAEQELKARTAATLEVTAAERAEVEALLREGLRLADVEMLRGAAERGRKVLEEVRGANASVYSSLVRVLQVAEHRLEEHDEREDSRRRKLEHEERVRTGRAADWNMTPAEFWRYVKEGNVQRVRAGLKAKLPVCTRSQDGEHFTVVHVACQGVSSESEEETTKRLEVLQELLTARAHVNGVDAEGRTPLDLVMGSSNANGSSSFPALERLRELGLRTASEVAAEARLAAKSPAASKEPTSPTRPLQAGHTPTVGRRRFG